MSIDVNNIDAYQKKFGQHLKQLRHSKGLSQSQLGALCNLEKTSISRIENGRVNVTLKSIVILSQGLELPTIDLFDFK